MQNKNMQNKTTKISASFFVKIDTMSSSAFLSIRQAKKHLEEMRKGFPMIDMNFENRKYWMLVSKKAKIVKVETIETVVK